MVIDATKLDALLEDARDWSHYNDRHGSNWQSNEWAEKIARALADLGDEK